MKTINTKDYISYNREALHEFLKLQHQTEFKIVIPKNFIAGQHVNFAIYWEYHLIGYSGYLLNEIATRFTFLMPLPGETDPFMFGVEISQMDKFADILYSIIAVFFDDDEEEEDDEEDETGELANKKPKEYDYEAENKDNAIEIFLLAAQNYFKEAIKSETAQSVTGEFLKIADQYHKIKNCKPI